MKLLLLHPLVAYRDCGNCAKWWYDEETGKVVERGGEPVLRPDSNALPCRLRGVGCAKGTPEDQHTLSDKNQKAYQFYLECRAVGKFPDDALVRKYSSVIRMVEDSIERQQQEISTLYLKAISRIPRLGV